MTPARIVKQVHAGRCFLQFVSTGQDKAALGLVTLAVGFLYDVAAVSGLTIEARRGVA